MKIRNNISAVLLLLCFFAVGGSDSSHDIAASLEMFVDELPDMPKLKGYVNLSNPAHLRIGMFQTKWKFHRDLPWSRVFAYGASKETATVPGPTIETMHGVETFVTWENHLPRKHILPWDPTLTTANPKHGGIPTVVHLHGGIHEPQSDGHPLAWFTAEFSEKGAAWKKAKYEYRNVQAPGNLWYHDHALGFTRVNLLAGLLGAYVIRNPKLETPFNLPSGSEYDRHLLIFDRSFAADGSIYMNSTGNNPSIHPQWQPEYFGDAIIVNGKAWPFMKVKRRKYRFRIVNVSNARFYRLALSNGLNMTHIGSDSAYLPKPVTVKDYLLGPSEIADLIIDFSYSSTDAAILTNSAEYPYPSGDPVDDLSSRVMKFVIEGPAGFDPEGDRTRIPDKLVECPRPKRDAAIHTRYISFYEYESSTGEPTHLFINGLPFDAAATETPKQGSSEVWHVINLTEDNHPLHIHLALFFVVQQIEILDLEEFKSCMDQKNDAVKCDIQKHAKGKTVAVAGPDSGWKNVYKMEPGFMTTIIVDFSLLGSSGRRPYPFNASDEPGYVYHCHILDHEDNEMMRPLKVRY
ncbi:hypothetical protein KI387_012548 [Taxus chinensis]|uniref:Multicopper oxidase n=1 Tax=Taxus chinensis TaxID=29808 RepID=A0AA38CIG1_TAXCH|nr:hypothetical protein KI387_012548 [Taxus chinensis]